MSCTTRCGSLIEKRGFFGLRPQNDGRLRMTGPRDGAELARQLQYSILCLERSDAGQTFWRVEVPPVESSRCHRSRGRCLRG